MILPAEIEIKMNDLKILCSKYSIKKLFFFGSIVNGNFNPKNSDVDILVELAELPPIERGEKLIKFWNELEHLFARKVDLLTQLSLKNPYLKLEIEESKHLIYDQSR